MAKKHTSRRRKARHNPDTAQETLARLEGMKARAEAALAKTDPGTMEYARLRRELRSASTKASHYAGKAAGITRTVTQEFPLTAVMITAVVALFIGYQIGKPSEPAVA